MARPAKVRKEVYEFICKFKEENDGIPPTYQQIADNFGWAAPSNAWDHVMGLERDHLIEMDSERNYRLIGGEYTAP